MSRANEKIKEMIMNDHYPTQEEYQAIMESEKILGVKRYLEMPDNYFDDIEAKVTIDPTGEMRNKQAILTSLSTIMGDVVKSFNPQTGTFGVFDDPRLAKIFNTIVELSGAGISPASFGSMNKPSSAIAQGTQPMQAQPSPVQNVPAPVA